MRAIFAAGAMASLLSSAALRELGEAPLDEYARRLAALIAVLLAGVTDETDETDEGIVRWSDPAWRAAYRRYWQRIEHV